MGKKLFGTDGIRAVAGEFPLDPRTIQALGQALVRVLRANGLQPAVVIGRDTRESGPWMERSFVQGFSSRGGTAVSAGVIPTSAISLLTAKRGFAAGVVLSASHNPFQDNGIKIFAPAGIKIPDEWETVLEEDVLTSGHESPAGDGRAEEKQDLADEYVDYLKGRTRAGSAVGNLKIVLDCSNGASSTLAPRVFGELGYDVIVLHNTPDGRNINLGCGSLHPEKLAEKVVESRASLGIAYDGDADRAVWVDEKGNILNGDHTLYVQSFHMMENGRLPLKKVVATTMSNLGLEIALHRAGIELARTKVGDKYVFEEMTRLGANLGGERSGHTIFLDDMQTGDGILTSLKMLEVMNVKGRPLSELTGGLYEFPQVLVNVRVARKVPFDQLKDVLEAVKAVKVKLKDEGRVDLRYSGTEPVARIMVEARDWETVSAYAQEIAEAVKRNLGDKTSG